MTALLETPAPTVEIIEQRQPDVPLTCTENGTFEGPDKEECGRRAIWEGMCMGCGFVFRRCQEHYDEEAADAVLDADGVPFACAYCDTWFYLEQYVRIGA